MEGELHDEGQLYQDFEEWLSTRGIQPNRGFFYEEEKHKSTRIEGLTPQRQKIGNQSPEGAITFKNHSHSNG